MFLRLPAAKASTQDSFARKSLEGFQTPNNKKTKGVASPTTQLQVTASPTESLASSQLAPSPSPASLEKKQFSVKKFFGTPEQQAKEIEPVLSNKVVPYQRQQQSKLQKEAALVMSAYLQKLAELEKEDPEEAVTGRQGGRPPVLEERRGTAGGQLSNRKKETDPSRKQELFAFQKMKLREEIQMILEESQPQKQKLGQLQGESSR